MEKIYFNNFENQKIWGIIEEPNQIKNEIIIIIHGAGANKESGPKHIAEELIKRNINSIRIDLDDQGESEPRHENSTISSYVKTVETTINYLKKQRYKTINLIGTSFGGIVAMATALKRKEIKKILLRAPVADYYKRVLDRYSKDEIKEFKKQGFYNYTKSNGKKLKITYKRIEDSKKYNMYEKAKKIQIPVLIIHGTDDKNVNYKTSEKLIKEFPKGRLILIKNADHSLGINGDYRKSLKILGDWFENKLS